MIRRIFRPLSLVMAVIMLLAMAGCSSNTVKTPPPPPAPAGIREVRAANIGSAWTMKQLEISLESKTSLLLKLPSGAKVSGFYYLTRGNNVNFKISGESVIYQSAAASASANITSDRFEFTSTDAQGLAYTLELTPNEKGAKKAIPVVFFEVIYPVAGELFVPMETK
jgi:hypothetical protein